MELTVHRNTVFRIVGVLVLLLAGVQVFACGFADACTAGSTSSSDCDQPQGDNCLCCCHHIIPVTEFTLDAAEHPLGEPTPPPILSVRTVSAHIDHPPQL